jgi:hypothetical protein
VIAWVSIGLAAFAVVIDVLGIFPGRVVTNNTIVGTVNGTTYVTTTTVISPLPVWMNILRVLAIVTPLVGLVLAIVALRRANTNRATAIVGTVLNALLLCGLFFIA